LGYFSNVRVSTNPGGFRRSVLDPTDLASQGCETESSSDNLILQTKGVPEVRRYD